MQLKRGYENGSQAIEIYEGNLDVILYNNKPKTSFYFYRFPAELYFGEESRGLHLIYPHEVKPFLEERGINYEDLIRQLVNIAIESGIKERYEM